MNEVFFQLGATLGLALLVSWLMKFLKQPLIIGYIITGIIVGPAVSGIVTRGSQLEAFSHLGIALLLFIVGLGLKPNVIKEVGRVAFITGIAQIVVTTVVGFFIVKALGFNAVISLYLSFAFALSSTIIILRLLFDKQEQDTLYGRITIGFLLVQDVAAMLFFIVMSAGVSIGSGEFVSMALLLLVKLALVVFGIFILIRYVVPHIDKLFADSKEMLFVFALGVCFVMASIFYLLGFPVELGALLAGVVLSVSPYQREIGHRMQSLRDFFLIFFFIILGTNVQLADVQNNWPLVIAFSLFILIGNPLLMILIMRSLRYTLKVSFLSGLIVAQISEFSLIIIGLGIGLGSLPKELLAPVTVVGIITIAVSSYYITYNNQIYYFVKKPLRKIFSDEVTRKEKKELDEQYEAILFGAHRLGGGLVEEMRRQKIKLLTVDHDPVVIEELVKKKVACLYGSADDPDLLDDLLKPSVKLIVSTVPELDVNLALLTRINKRHKKINVLCVANHRFQAEKLYAAGADYVIMPHYLGRRFMVELLRTNKLNQNKYKTERKRHQTDLAYLNGAK
jgi:Kef-type K+ transport system membrane component KefB